MRYVSDQQQLQSFPVFPLLEGNMKVSAVIAIYNVEQYLDRCLNSLRAQNFTDMEVLCVNDGSTDNSEDIIRKYVELDQRFILLNKENGGLSDARNYGLKKARGEYILFVDGDDFVEENLVLCAYERAEQDQLDLAVFAYHQYYLKDQTKELISLQFEENKVYNLKDDPSLLCYVNNSAWNKIYRKTLFTDNDIIYPKGYNHQDLGTTAKLLYRAERIGFIKTALYNYLVDRPNNITQERNQKIYHIIKMEEEILSYYKKEGIFDTYYEELKYLCGINMIQSLRKLISYTDKVFVRQFVEDSFRVMKSYFPDYPDCRYPIAQNRSDKVYLNKELLIMYLWYHKNIRGDK